MKDFFISYNKADRVWAEWIAWQLEDADYSTVLQAWDFQPGSNFVVEMDSATKAAERTIAVLSPDYLASGFTRAEWTAAFAKDPTGEQGKLLPVLVREIPNPGLEGLLGPIVHIKLVGHNEKSAKEALLAGAKRGRAKPPSAPGFPGTPIRSVQDKPRFPGTLPPIWNVPHNRNVNFTGRENLLAQLRKALSEGKSMAITQPQAIHGLGGIGKTQLAVEYAYRHRDDYSIVWWVKAEDPATLATDYGELASKLDLPEKEASDQSQIVKAVRDWLGRSSEWLLVFDNVQDPEDLQSYLPQGGTGHFLITSRNRIWASVASPVVVEVLGRNESVDFLLKRTRQMDQVGAGKLAEVLGDLPLALEHAGAYIDETGIPIAEYLNLYETRRQELWRFSKPPTGYPDTVATTWEISFEQVKKKSPARADLLSLFAFLAPEDIAIGILIENREFLPGDLAQIVADPLLLLDAVAALRQYSLVVRDEHGLLVHRLVQAVTYERLQEEERRNWASVSVLAMNNAFPTEADDVRQWPLCSRLITHVLAVTRHAEALGVALDKTVALLNRTGDYLWGRAEYSTADQILRRALEIGEAALGPDDPEVATSLNNLGSVLQALGDLAGAKAHFERALAIGEAALGPDHPAVAIRVSKLGSVLQDLGDLAGAKAHFERSLSIDEKAYGPNHPNVARDVSNLGNVLQAVGDLAGAKTHFERALAIDEKAYGPDHPEAGTDVSNLGSVLQALGDLAGAKAHFERALAIGEAALGPDHPAVAIRVSKLGMVLRTLGDLTGAKSHYERALAIDEKAYGLKHPSVARDVNNLGGVLQDLGDLVGAKSHYERALKMFWENRGKNHPSTVTVRKNLESLGRK